MSTQGSKLAATILSYLKGAGRLGVLPELVEALHSSPEYKRSQHQVVITSAAKLEAGEVKKIEAHVKKVVGSAYVLETKVDSSLLAGFTLQIDDTLTDASFQGKIEKLHASLNAKD